MQRFEMIGRVGKDLEVKYTQNQKKILDFTMAVNEGVGDKKVTTWVNVRAWESKAENIGKYVCKGDNLYISGKLRNDKYVDRNGVEKTYTYILLDNFELIEPKKEAPKNELEQMGIDTRGLDFYNIYDD